MAMAWQGVKSMFRSYSIIPKDQQELLYSEESRFPPSKGKKFPPANIPAKVVRELSLSADHAHAEAERTTTDSSTSLRETEQASAQIGALPGIKPPSELLSSTQNSDPDAPVGSWSPSPERQPRAKQSLPPDSSLPQPSLSSRLISRPDGFPPSSDDGDHDDDDDDDDEGRNVTASNSNSNRRSRSRTTNDEHISPATDTDLSDDDTDTSSERMEQELPSALDDSSLESSVAVTTQKPADVAESPVKPKTRTPSPDLPKGIVNGSPLPHHTRPVERNQNLLALPSSNVHRSQRNVELASSASDLGLYAVTQVTLPFTSSKSDPVVPSTWQPPANQQADPRLTRSFGNDQNAPSLTASPTNPLQPRKAPFPSNSTGTSTGSSALQSYRQSSPIHVLESPIMLMQNTQNHKRAAPSTAVSPGRDRKHRKQGSTTSESQDPAFDIKAMKTDFLAKLCEERGVFELFCEAYPAHRVLEEKFKSICQSKLLPVTEAVPEANYDDFVIKYSTMYESYLLESLLKNRTPVGYAEFYKDNAGTLANDQFILNRKTLQLYLGDEVTVPQTEPAANDDIVVEDASEGNPAGNDANLEPSPQPAPVPLAAPVPSAPPEPPAAPRLRTSRISKRRTALTDFIAKFADLKANKPPDTGLTHSWDI